MHHKLYIFYPIKYILAKTKWGEEKLTEETETVKVTLELPKQIAEFIKESWSTDNLEETLTKEVLEMCLSRLDADANDQGVLPREIISKYDLLPIFKKFGVHIPEFYGVTAK
jgi:hypothetical protein